jgi:hypothetical protein
MSAPETDDDDAWQDEANFGERPELPEFDLTDEEIEAALWRAQQEKRA